MPLIRTLYKILLLIVIIILGMIMVTLLLRNTMPTQGAGSRLAQLWHRSVLAVLGVELKVSGNRENANVLFIPNHITWLDISVLGSLIPTHFLSKIEVKNWPVIGYLATRAGTLYLERGYHHATAASNRTMQKALEQKHNVVLFAEGTTTEGSPRKFHGRLMQSAIDANSLVQPVAIFYPDETGHSINRNILYIDEMHFLRSAFTILGLKKITAEIHFLKPVSAAGKTRNELARYCHDRVIEIFNNK
jgi:1-acyl-sn-glycerol-3-phosphate acyltransferase